MLKSQELVYDNYKPFFSQSFMNVRNKACRHHSCVKVSPQENWWDMVILPFQNAFVSFQQNDLLKEK